MSKPPHIRSNHALAANPSLSGTQAVFLDAGLTLVHSELRLPELCLLVGRAHGLSVSREALEAAVLRASVHLHTAFRGSTELWASDRAVEQLWLDYYASVYREAGVAAPDIPGCAAEVYRRYTQPGAWTLYPDVLPLLEYLREKNYTVGVVSDWGSELASKVLLPLGVGPYIDFMVVSTVMREAKPSMGLYREALARAGVPPHKAVHVGDNYITDVLGARSAGIEGILLDRGNEQGAGSLDCRRIGSLAELAGLLEE